MGLEQAFQTQTPIHTHIQDTSFIGLSHLGHPSLTPITSGPGTREPVCPHTQSPLKLLTLASPESLALPYLFLPMEITIQTGALVLP